MAHPYARRAGFGLLELLIAVAILAVFLGSLALSSGQMLRMGAASDVDSQMQELSATTLSTILDDLRLTGAHAPFPYLYVDGAAEEPFLAHVHAPAVEHARPDEPDFGPNREIVLRHPADDDDDGVPDCDADGALLWSPNEIGYALVTGADGVNVLERRVGGRTQRVVARHVERVVFDDILSSGLELPLDTIRVRVWFRLPDGRGGELRQRAEASVRLRN